MPAPLPPAGLVDLIPAPKDVGPERLAEHITASKDPDGAVRRKAAAALGAFLTHADELLRRKAADTLAEMGGDAEPATAALREALKDPNDKVRKSARLALDQIELVLALAKTAKTRETILTLAKELKAKEPAKRIKALEQIAAYGPEANFVGELLIDAMADPVPAVREVASGVLEKVNPKVYPHVFTILFGMSKFRAAEELGDLGSDAVIAVPLLLYCHQNTALMGFRSNMFPVVAKIAPKDKRFAAAVLTQIATKPGTGVLGAPGGVTPGIDGWSVRNNAIAQLKVIDAEPAEKVKALVTALGDGHDAGTVINALQEFGKDAEPALPLLKKLKLSPDDYLRKAATEAIKKIEG